MVHNSDELIIFEILTRVPVRTVGTILSFPLNNVTIYSHLDGLLCVRLNHTSELALWNSVIGSYKLLSTHDRHGFFEHNADAVGLYIDAYDDYKVLHIKRMFVVFDVNVYSRRFESWRNIPFLTRSKFVSLYFSVSSGTFCADTLYFTVCDCWIRGENVLICFDVNSEIFKEITFPPLVSAGMTFRDLVNIKNELYMFVSTGIELMWVELWMLEDDHWIKSLLFPPIPPIPLGLFCEITHFMTNGNWFLVTNRGEPYVIETNRKPFESFYASNWFRCFEGAMFMETVQFPTL
ncbi:hypothetical protein E3N88_32142 [Mikania micrantha]|uniref:F-box associated beta-propeller type 3 domain-containing protein n=1 Tax=Mikania micrantha TaxID=192012 RepID=A0A5N6M8B5_9ASTR|nr:hypothetical protein E3N88_32142 [Mikania micrantha]